MAETYANIHVRASEGSEWLHVLRVPLQIIPRFVRNTDVDAIKYLKYLAYCICGSDGCLSRSATQERSSFVDAVPSRLDELVGSFYFYPSTYENIIADPDALKQPRSVSDSTSESSSCSSVKRIMVGTYERSVFTNAPVDICSACHLIPQEKGSKVLLHQLFI